MHENAYPLKLLCVRGLRMVLIMISENIVGILELREFVVLVERACKVDKLTKERRKEAIESRDSRKR